MSDRARKPLQDDNDDLSLDEAFDARTVVMGRPQRIAAEAESSASIPKYVLDAMPALPTENEDSDDVLGNNFDAKTTIQPRSSKPRLSVEEPVDLGTHDFNSETDPQIQQPVAHNFKVSAAKLKEAAKAAPVEPEVQVKRAPAPRSVKTPKIEHEATQIRKTVPVDPIFESPVVTESDSQPEEIDSSSLQRVRLAIMLVWWRIPKLAKVAAALAIVLLAAYSSGALNSLFSSDSTEVLNQTKSDFLTSNSEANRFSVF